MTFKYARVVEKHGHHSAEEVLVPVHHYRPSSSFSISIRESLLLPNFLGRRDSSGIRHTLSFYTLLAASRRPWQVSEEHSRVAKLIMLRISHLFNVPMRLYFASFWTQWPSMCHTSPGLLRQNTIMLIVLFITVSVSLHVRTWTVYKRTWRVNDCEDIHWHPAGQQPKFDLYCHYFNIRKSNKLQTGHSDGILFLYVVYGFM